ncbi:MAG: methionyl-tRNA formyltransferase [Patescibacteria group bacterium]
MVSERIIFFGSPAFTVSTLKALLDAHRNVVAVVTKPDKPLSPHVKVFAQQANIPVYQPASLRNGSFLTIFKESAPDICVVIAYGKIFPAEYLAVPKFGFLNIHFSLLPAYRGPSPLQTAILNGEKESGVTLAMLAPEVDSGPIIAQIKLPIPHDKYFPELLSYYAEQGNKLLIDSLGGYITRALLPQSQDHAKATFTKIITRDDARINWSKSAEEIYNRIRALNPEPGTWTLFGNKTLKISRAHIVSGDTTGQTGLVGKTNGIIAIEAGEGLLAPDVIQLEGKKAMDIKTFADGHSSFLGSTLA